MGRCLAVSGKQWAVSACLVLGFCAGGRVAGAQGGAAYGQPQRDGAARAALSSAVAAARARLEYERAAAEYDRSRELHRRRMLSDADLDARRLDAERARLAYVEESLAAAAPHVTIERAAKERTRDGRTTVRLTLRNASSGAGPLALGAARARPAYAAADDSASSPDALDTGDALDAVVQRVGGGVIRDLFVSLKADPGANGTTISIPYERHVAALRRGRAATIVFELYRDVPDLVVSVSYGDRVEERRVFLDRAAGAAGAARFAVQSAQLSQEADLGAQAIFDLRVDRLAAADAARLVVEGMAPGVAYELRDPESKARLTQIRFGDGEETRRLQLVVALPQRATAAVRADVPLRFAVVARAGDVADDNADTSRGGSRSGDAGRIALELVPRGLPRVELRAINLYHELAAGDSAVTEVVVRNSGSRALDALQLRADAPPGWRVEFAPPAIPALAVDAERPVRLVVHAPRDASVGDYEARVRVASAAADHRVETEDKVLRLHVADGASVAGTMVVIVLVGAIVAGAGMLGRKWMRR